ncbi:uncharacterized protein H6S33_010898 [Morchella sextelata]|uniref:uncharacterized protein n=1 Tax=Morchella sextelata TaxID=1174677 RepID=UPI001D040772|nr:uncharacterized protein H6S33_010898 [Morchella sextelata]KAH0611633.1 hypothetical protein H6S33_010898 [Morchella sextelata]
MNFLFLLLLLTSLTAAAAVMRQNSTDLTPFTFLGRCSVPAGYRHPSLEELGGLSPHSVKKCQSFSGSPGAADVAALSKSIVKRRACCVKKHGAGKCNTLRRVGNAEAVICGEAGWCHPCGMVAVLVADIARSCKWGEGGEVFAAGTWNVKVGGRGSVTVLGM